MSEQKKPSDAIESLEQRAMNVLLAEVYRDVRPPDLSDEIISRLNEHVDAERSGGDRSIVSRSTGGEPEETHVRSESDHGRSRRRWTAAVAALAALAATVTLVVVNGSRLLDGQDGNAVQQHAAVDRADNPDRPRDETDSGATDPSASDTDTGTATGSPPQPLRRGIQLASGDDEPRPEPEEDRPPKRLPTRPASSVPVALVSADVKSDLTEYWKSIGINPAADASTDEIVSRLAASLGVKLPSESLGDPEAIRDQLRNPGVARAIAERWLNQITDGGVRRVDSAARDRLVDDLVNSLRAEVRFDGLIRDWIAGDGDTTSSFYQAVSAGGEHRMVRRLGSLTMSVDLRCVQCHDAMIEGTKQQDNYWSFAALLRHGVKRQSGQWQVNREEIDQEVVFYPLLDGRQKAALPSISPRWLSAEQPIVGVERWADSLVESPALARGVVNSLWQLVYGQPLRGRVFDTRTAPHHDSLVQLERRLTEDFVNSGFDLGRLLALVIASPASSRSVPEALLPENLLVVSDRSIDQVLESVNAFAAAPPRGNVLPTPRRIDIAMQRIGAAIDGCAVVLGQDSGQGRSDQGGGGNAKRRSGPTELADDFPARASELPVQWLSSLDSIDSKIEHLAYLAGYTQIPKRLADAIETVREAEQNEALLLQRVWWLLKP